MPWRSSHSPIEASAASSFVASMAAPPTIARAAAASGRRRTNLDENEAGGHVRLRRRGHVGDAKDLGGLAVLGEGESSHGYHLLEIAVVEGSCQIAVAVGSFPRSTPEVVAV